MPLPPTVTATPDQHDSSAPGVRPRRRPGRRGGCGVVADLRKLSLGQRDYYTDEIARDREEYLSGHGEAPGEWLGGGAAQLGMARLVSTEQFQRTFDGRDPATGDL